MTDEQLYAEMLTPTFRRLWRYAASVQRIAPGSNHGEVIFANATIQGYFPTIALRVLWLMEHMRTASDEELREWADASRKARGLDAPAAPTNGTPVSIKAENAAKILAILAAERASS